MSVYGCKLVYRSVVVTQVEEWESSLPVEKQAVIFLSGFFSKAELNWAVNEKEAFPLILALERQTIFFVF